MKRNHRFHKLTLIFKTVLFVVNGVLLVVMIGACQGGINLLEATRPVAEEGDTEIAVVPTETPSPLPASTSEEILAFPKIDRQPRPATVEDWANWGYGQTLTELPLYDPNSSTIWQVDLRTQDLSQLDLRESNKSLFNAASFDEQTLWPPEERLPVGYDPKKIMELGKNPGLGLQALHTRGITGKGVGIAIIDGAPLHVDHPEYTDRLRLYEEFAGLQGRDPVEMHGPAVASLSVGKTVGVAPGADLYYIAVPLDNGQDANGNWKYDFKDAARAVKRIVEINQQLPEDRKIRALSMSFGWMEGLEGYEELAEAVKEAQQAGIFVVSASPSMEKTNGFGFFGLGRSPLDDPDLVESYGLSHFLAGYFGDDPTNPKWQKSLWLPMDSRTTASPMGNDEYVFYRLGGESWRIPYLAGMYALAAQVDPAITPERFNRLALQTGNFNEIEYEGKMYKLGPILDPEALIGAIQTK